MTGKEWMMKNKKVTISSIIVTVFLIAIALTTIMPFIWMLSASIKFESDVFKYPIEWIPKQINAINNYKEVWKSEYMLGTMYFNSIKITVIATILDVMISALAAYAFAKINFKYKNIVFMIFIACWMIPPQVNLAPKFILFSKLGLYNTHRGLILTYLFSAYGMFLLKQYFMAIPDSLCEAAKVDGAGHIKIFSFLVLPVSKPALVTLGMLRFVWTWNNYQGPLVFLNSKELFTIQRGLTQFSDPQSGVVYSLMMAASVCAILPLIIMFLIAQNQVIEGIASGAVKG